MSFCYFESNYSIFYSLFLSPHLPFGFTFILLGLDFMLI